MFLIDFYLYNMENACSSQLGTAELGTANSSWTVKPGNTSNANWQPETTKRCWKLLQLNTRRLDAPLDALHVLGGDTLDVLAARGTQVRGIQQQNHKHL